MTIRWSSPIDPSPPSASADGGILQHHKEGHPTAITVHLYYTGTGGAARAFAQEMTAGGTVQAIRQEEGNLQYQYFFPMEDEETVLLIDSWASQQALDAHHASPMMDIIIALREKYDLHMRAERFHSDGQGLPPGDAAFLRK